MTGRWDFFVSYTSADAAWAEWIAWQLEAAEYHVLLQRWDILPGNHWLADMEMGVRKAERTLAVLSEDYLESDYGKIEWTAALRADPGGSGRKLIPIRITEFRTPTILGGIVWVDLVGLVEDEARHRLLAAMEEVRSGRAKPSQSPAFPGVSPSRVPGRDLYPPTPPPSFPGSGWKTGGSGPVTPLVFRRWNPERAMPLTESDPPSAGAYTLRHRLSLGGDSTVYLGEDDAGKPVAVKMLHRHLRDDEETRARFAREAAHGRAVRSAHVPAVLAADLEAVRPYLVTEFADGPTLGERVRRRGPFSGTALRQLAVHLLTALGDLHRAGIAHGDLSPANVILSSSGPQLIDLGASRTAREAQAWRPAGTVWLLAPERWQGGRAAAAADVFAWGCLVAYAGTGRRPFPGESEPELRRSILRGAPDLTGLDGAMHAVVEAALHRDPAARPTIVELSARLNAPADPAAPPAPPERTTERIGRRTVLGTAAAALAGLGLAADSVPPAPGLRGDRESQANAVAARADGLRADDAALARRLDLAAYLIRPTPLTRANLLRHSPVRTLEGHAAPVKGLAFHPVSGMLASAGSDGTARLWDIPGRGLTPVMLSNGAEVLSVAFGPGGTLLLGGADGRVTVGDVRKGAWRPRRFEAHERGSQVLRLRFSRNGRLLATAGSDGVARIWNPADLTRPLRQVMHHAAPAQPPPYVWGVAFCSADRVLVTAGDAEDGPLIKLWRLDDLDPGRPDPAPVEEPVLRVPGKFGYIGDIAHDPGDDRAVAVVSSEIGGRNPVRRLRITDPSGPGDPVDEFGGFDSRTRETNHSVSFSPDGAMLATGNAGDGHATVRLWALEDTVVSTPLSGHRGPVWSTAFGPGGKSLAAGGDDKIVYLWDIDPDAVLTRLYTSPSALPSAALWHQEFPSVPHPGLTGRPR
ncbi:TIR domain-containing protein [Planomonospora sp. ID82291]|uniref:TIR domain-containing protein n=1 Tax=Planomonospora sp. ID82291 TaxID=2738136 RepID=UPI0018C42DDA|nr:TIR domain-containing protein [Planomonospora sp. ID82291]MBG0814894.1 TIR domain-containing protein [Planomonospora sp. ID82291]